ncbi:MAG: TIGR04348 family glycosyltransferase [Gammaproteobacteria bacterium]|nr:TIGR04348 family glycosyltransferase [Gammaproteobacteria bacterium]
MHIILITPHGRRGTGGNHTTALRWASLLRELGHRVDIQAEWDCESARPEAPVFDVMVAIHAFRSASSIRRFKTRYPQRPLVLLLSGTDVYEFQHSDPEPTLRSMQLADALVGLHWRVADDIPRRFRDKLQVIVQSATPLSGPRRPAVRHFDALVVAHLRAVKDPLRAAHAGRLAPVDSALRVLHLGQVLEPTLAEAARAEMQSNPRYRWLGGRTRGEVRRRMRHASLLVISSLDEGGANVVSEAIVAGLPILASDIPGNRGLLGDAHPGYFPVGDEQALAALLLRAEREPCFLEDLQRSTDELRAQFSPESERDAWASLLERLSEQRCGS